MNLKVGKGEGDGEGTCISTKERSAFPAQPSSKQVQYKVRREDLSLRDCDTKPRMHAVPYIFRCISYKFGLTREGAGIASGGRPEWGSFGG